MRNKGRGRRCSQQLIHVSVEAGNGMIVSAWEWGAEIIIGPVEGHERNEERIELYDTKIENEP
jgi:hypothetical protein